MRHLLLLLLVPAALSAAPLIATSTFCSVPGNTFDQDHVTVSSTSNACSVESDYISSPLSEIYRINHQFAQASAPLYSYTSKINGSTWNFP